MGRTIATALFWAATAYLVAVGFYSIPKQIWVAHDPPQSADAAQPCGEGIRELQHDLFHQAASRVAAPQTGRRPADRSWFAGWDRRYRTLADSCRGPSARGYALLESLRHRVETAIHRFDDSHAPLAQAIERNLIRAEKGHNK